MKYVYLELGIDIDLMATGHKLQMVGPSHTERLELEAFEKKMPPPPPPVAH